MATVTLIVSPTAPNHGDTVTATYVVAGNDGTPGIEPEVVIITGVAEIGDQPLEVSTTVTLPGTPPVPPLPETFTVPTCAGLTFAATTDPKVFVALVP